MGNVPQSFAEMPEGYGLVGVFHGDNGVSVVSVRHIQTDVIGEITVPTRDLTFYHDSIRSLFETRNQKWTLGVYAPFDNTPDWCRVTGIAQHSDDVFVVYLERNVDVRQARITVAKSQLQLYYAASISEMYYFLDTDLSGINR